MSVSAQIVVCRFVCSAVAVRIAVKIFAVQFRRPLVCSSDRG
jgi:hypothetical protein